MCNIGKPQEIVVVDPLVLPAPLPGTEVEPEIQPVVPTPVPVTAEYVPFRLRGK
jgi:hypothetical protein